jgi:PAS domain S-box-containing protein
VIEVLVTWLDGDARGRRTRAAWTYAAAAALVALTLWVRLLIDGYASNRPLLILFFLPILLSAYCGGLGPGWLATALSVASAAYFLFPPFYSVRVERPLDLFQLLVVTGVGGLLSWLIEVTRRARHADVTRRGDARFRSALDSMMEGCQIVGFDWRWLYINEVAARYGRRPPADFPGRTLMELYPGIETTPLFLSLERCMDDRIEQATEIQFVYPDGGSGWFRLGIRPVPEGILIVSFDVTEARRAAQALRESHERTRSIMDTSPDGVITMDHEGRILEFNPAAERIFGHRREDVRGRALADVVIPAQLRDAHRGGLARYLATGEGPVLGKRLEVSGVRADGSAVALELSINRMPGGGPPMFAGFVRDVTERKRAERALGESQQLLEAVADNSPAVIYVKDLQGRYLMINRAYEENFGLTREAILGRTDHDLFPQEAADAFRAMDQRVATAGVALTEEESAPQADGLHAYISVKCPLRDAEGKTYGVFGISTDITNRKRWEEALRESEERFRAMADGAPVLIWLSGTDKLCTWFNRQWLEFVGRSMERELGNGWAENVHPEDFERCLATYVGAFDAREAFNMEYRLRRHDGAWRWVLDQGIPRYGFEREFAGYIGSCIDVTESREASEALRESQEHYSALAETLPHLVWTCRPDGWCDYLSRQWVEYTGRPAEEQLGYGWAEQLHPDDRERVQGAWSVATRRGDAYDVEFRIRRADGAYRWFATRAVPLRDSASRIVKWFGSNTDIEDYKTGQQALQVQLARLSLLDQIARAIGERQDLRSIFQVVVRSLEDHLPVDFAAICSYDAVEESLTVTCVGVKSQPLASELAMPEESHIGIDPNGLSRCVRGQLVYERDLEQVAFPFPRRLAGGGLRSLVVVPLLVEGMTFGVLMVARREVEGFSSGDCEFLKGLSVHVALAAHQAQLYGVLEQAYQDLRRTQQAVMQQERLKALGEMASGVAHDINNAISPVALYTESLLEREPALSPRAREYLEIIQRAIDDVAQTVGRMREFYRQREPQLSLTPVRLDRLVQQVVDLTRARWHDMPQQRGSVIRVVTELKPDTAPVLALDSEVRDALVNLVFNAVDAMPDGGTLTFRTGVVEPGGGAAQDAAYVEVSDSGIGMDDDTRHRCLEPFFTTKGDRGTGLGLATVYGTLQRHNGEIDIESSPGIGTTVRLTFPASAPLAAEESAAPGPAAGGLRILVIDDDPLVLESLRDALEEEGHVVVTANHGQAGIDTFVAAQERREPFDAVITDLGMPNVDGRQVASAVKAASAATPVLLLTGWGQRLAVEGNVPANVDMVLSKPPKMRDLRLALASARKP